MAREAANRSSCSSKLRQVAVAVQTYHDNFGSFPTRRAGPGTANEVLNWRVLILPQIEQRPMYDKIDFRTAPVPWDNNYVAWAGIELSVFQCPSDGGIAPQPGPFWRQGRSNYCGLRWPKDRQQRRQQPG